MTLRIDFVFRGPRYYSSEHSFNKVHQDHSMEQVPRSSTFTLHKNNTNDFLSSSLV